MDTDDEYWAYMLYGPRDGWVMLNERGLNWAIQREATRFVTNELDSLAFLVFSFDGDYWGYELVKSGIGIDHHVSEVIEGHTWFEESFNDDPDYWAANSKAEVLRAIDRLCKESLRGNAEVVAAACPWLRPEDIEPYLVQSPLLLDADEAYLDGIFDVHLFRRQMAEYNALNIPARPGDEFPRWRGWAVVDFMRMLGVPIDSNAEFIAPVARRFWVSTPRPQAE